MQLPLNVSILICAHNEESNIAALLVSIANQTARNNIKEILIADNSSSDRTVQVCEQISETYDLPTKTFQLKTNNMGHSRALLVSKARTDYVAFVDADCKVQPNWLQTLITHYTNLAKFNHQLAGVCGPNRLPEKNLFQKLINRNLDTGFLHGFSSQTHRETRNNGRAKDHLPTTNAFFLKSAIVECGNFSYKFDRVGEDLDLGLRMTSREYQLIALATPMVINDCASDTTSWCARMFRFGIAQGLTFGRRKNFTTLAIILFSGLLFSVPFLSPQELATGLLIWILATSLAARPVLSREFSSFKWLKSSYSYFFALFILNATIIFYVVGFYMGLIKRLSPTRVSSTLVAEAHL